ncbi:glycosyl hydrolase [bacterium]|nr:MAG: glycosyl hydrolase [bacterium]
MIEIRERRWLVDGRPTLVFAGEIHYFRLRREEWEDRIRKLKDVGCNAVATYVPWLVHEQREGEIDVSDVARFLDLCHRHGLWTIPRPGPFVMGEIKNEGIPFWVYQKYPETIPVTWEGKRSESKILDFLNAKYLACVEKWYAAVMPVFAERLQPKGGSVIGVQLDNEIGMLQWVTNNPDLSDDTLCDFARWVTERYGHGRYPFDLNDPVARAKELRNPTEKIGPRLLRDYGDYERNRFARYVAALRGFAEKAGVRDVPFIVNIHGTGGGRGTTYPIGIHQLYESYTQEPGYLSGSDHYLGELTRDNAQDLHFMNAFMTAVSRPEQPIGSMEFEVGSGDYGENGAALHPPAAADHKVRLSLFQENRFLNYYLLAGGRNPMMKIPPNDGNGRVGTTGERHGFAAPIAPEGNLNPTYAPLRATTHASLAIADKLADMDEEHDDVALAFLPDYYKTDLHRPGPMREIVQRIEDAREALASITRSMLALGFRYSAVDIQSRAITSGSLVLASSRHLDEAIQTKLRDYVTGGGRLLLYGELPRLDMEGRPCTVLADALGVRHHETLQASGDYHLSMQAEDEPEVRTWRLHTFDAPHGKPLVRVIGRREPTGVELSVGRGKAVVLGCNYPLHAPFYRSHFASLGLHPGLEHGELRMGILLNSMRNKAGERFVSVINLDVYEKRLRLKENGKPLFDGAEIVLPPKDARFLPLGVSFGSTRVVYATTELSERTRDRLRFRATGSEERMVVEANGTRRTIRTKPGESAEVRL